MCDFGPSHMNGGTILVSRLLEDYPKERLTVLIGSRFAAEAPRAGRLGTELRLPVTRQFGRFGLGRLKTALDYALLPVYGTIGAAVALVRGAQVVVTVPHSHLFLGAALAAEIARRPLVLLVHDDWVHAMEQGSWVLRHVARRLFGVVARRAARIYAVSEGMREILQTRDGVRAELQLPAITPPPTWPKSEPDGTELVVAFAGAVTGAVSDSLALLADLMRSDRFARAGVGSWRLDLYIPDDDRTRALVGSPSDHIRMRGWLSQGRLQGELLRATVLFLPFSFAPSEAYVTSTAFPTKTTNYLASGRPILVMGPPGSTTVRYATQEKFAEVVDTPDPEALLQALVRLWRSPERRETLVQRAQETLRRNHNIVAQRAEFREAVTALAQAGTR